MSCKLSVFRGLILKYCSRFRSIRSGPRSRNRRIYRACRINPMRDSSATGLTLGNPYTHFQINLHTASKVFISSRSHFVHLKPLSNPYVYRSKVFYIEMSSIWIISEETVYAVWLSVMGQSDTGLSMVKTLLSARKHRRGTSVSHVSAATIAIDWSRRRTVDRTANLGGKKSLSLKGAYRPSISMGLL